MIIIDATVSGTVLRAPSRSNAPFSISNVTITETDPLLTNKLLTATLSWGDSSLPVNLTPGGPTRSPVSIPKLSNVYAPGKYLVVITATNFREPVPDVVRAVYSVTVVGEAKDTSDTLGAVYGPILPLDSGFPNAAQWNFDLGSDIKILESSIKMLLLTSKGERVMEPEYGTSLRSLIFEPSTSAIEMSIQNDIETALAKWEPRVALDSFDIRRDGTSIIVSVNCTSKLTKSAFTTALSFARDNS